MLNEAIRDRIINVKEWKNMSGLAKRNNKVNIVEIKLSESKRLV